MNKILKRVSVIALGLAMAGTVGVVFSSKDMNKVNAEDTLVYDLQFKDYKDSSKSGYASTSDFTDSEIGWHIEGANHSLADGFGFGGKSTGTLKRSFYTTTAVTGTVSKITIELGNYSAASATFSVKAYSDSAFTKNETDFGSVNTTTADKDGVLVFSVQTPVTSYFYKFNVDVQPNNSGSNKYVLLKKVNFYNVTVSTDPTVEIKSESQDLAIDINENVTLEAEVSNSDASVVWSSSNTNVATIDASSGAVTGIASGSTTITAKITDGDTDYTDTTTLYVNQPEPEMIENASLASVLSNTEGNGKRLFLTEGIIKSWGSKPSSPASEKDAYGNMVITDGTTDVIVYGAAASTSTASKLIWDGIECIYNFTNGQTFKTDDLTKDLNLGDKVVLKCIRADYTSGDTITKEIKGLVMSTVVNSLTAIDVTPVKTQYDVGESIGTVDFSVKGTYAVSGEETIESSLCSISPSGELTTIGEKTVTISYGGKSDTYVITVNGQEVDITDITILEDELTLLSTDEPYELTSEVLPSNTTEEATWSSTNEEVATVNNGVVTYVGAGTTTISLSGAKGVKTASVAVTCKLGAKYTRAGVVATDDLVVTDLIEGAAYADFSKIKKTSAAVYAGQCGGTNGGIQLRSKNNDSGVITTASAGHVTKVALEWESHTASGRTVQVYGKNTAYADDTDLFDSSKRGDLLGEIVYGTSTELVVEGDYAYIGVRSKSDALYIAKLSISWDSSTVYTATLADINAIELFMNEKLHMADYDSKYTGSGDGSCMTYWPDVKTAFNALTDDQRGLFIDITTNVQYKGAYDRLIKWAEFNGDTLVNNVLENNPLVNRTAFKPNDASCIWIIVVISLVSVSTLGCLIYIRKSKKTLTK